MTRRRMPYPRVNRRSFMQLAALGGGAGLLAACGGGATSAPTQVPSGPTQPSSTNISWWNGYSTDTVKAAMAKVVPAFEAKFPHIDLEFELSGGPPGGGDLMEVLLSRIAGGNPPDSVTLFAPPSQYGALGSLEPIDDLMATAAVASHDAFYEGVLKTCQWQGKTYGLPASAGALAIFINKQKFEARGISTKREDFPKTWEEFKRLSAEFLVKENGEIKEAGFVPPWTASWQFPVWSGLNASQIFDAESTRYTLDSEENIGWLDFWLRWMDEQYDGDWEGMAQIGNWDGVYDNSTFVNQLSAMTIEGSWGTTDIDLPFEWEIVKLPYGPAASKSVTGFWPNWLALPKGSPHPQEAFQWIEFFATEGWAIWYEFIMDTPSWKGFPTDVITQKLIDSVGQERAQDIHNFFSEYLNDTAPMWNSPIDAFASDTLAAALDEVVHRVKSPQEALAGAQELCQAKLEETLKSGA